MVETHATLERWVDWIFDREVGEPWWNWDDDAEWIVLAEDVLLSHVTETFEHAGRHLGRFSDEQLTQGFFFLLDPEDGDQLRACLDPHLPVAGRAGAVLASAGVFEQLFAPRCTPALSNLDEETDTALNLACFMWWDQGPFHAEVEEPIALACLDAMERTLGIPHDACRESALHGLGHFQTSGSIEDRRRAILERFLAADLDLRPELREYAGGRATRRRALIRPSAAGSAVRSTGSSA